MSNLADFCRQLPTLAASEREEKLVESRGVEPLGGLPAECDGGAGSTSAEGAGVAREAALVIAGDGVHAIAAEVQRRQVAGGMPPFADWIIERWKARELERRARRRGGASCD